MLKPRFTPRATVQATSASWRLQIPPGAGGDYRLAQLDDYTALPRGKFPLSAPANLSLRCRASSARLPGTWGFGFWNDPFAFSLGMRGADRRLPALPNACWFFFASPENHLSFQDGLASSGLLAQIFRSPKVPSLLLLPGALGAPLLAVKKFSKWLRRLAGSIIVEDSLRLTLDVNQWHAYSLSWKAQEVTFSLDGAPIFQTQVSPRGPLGAVLWIDNQFAAWIPDGRIGMGTLPQKEAGWIEIENLEIKG
jgi:hypothetical protein